MANDRNILFVLADGEHARFVRLAEDNTLHGDATLGSFCAIQSATDPGSDEPTASCHTGSSAHHAPPSRHELHALEKARFGRAVATRLNAEAGSFDELVIIAPPHTLIAIRQRLNAVTDGKIVGTIPKDLTQTPDGELWPHLRWWIQPAQRATS